MPSVYYRFTAYTCDREWSPVSMEVIINICAVCVCRHRIHYHFLLCCRFWLLTTSHLTTNLTFVKPSMRHKKIHFSVPYCTIVLFRCHVKIQRETHVSNTLLPESLLHFMCRQKWILCTVWGYICLISVRQNLYLIQGQGQFDRRRKGWKDEESYDFKDSCTAVNLTL